MLRKLKCWLWSGHRWAFSGLAMQSNGNLYRCTRCGSERWERRR